MYESFVYLCFKRIDSDICGYLFCNVWLNFQIENWLALDLSVAIYICTYIFVNARMHLENKWHIANVQIYNRCF